MRSFKFPWKASAVCTSGSSLKGALAGWSPGIFCSPELSSPDPSLSPKESWGCSTNSFAGWSDSPPISAGMGMSGIFSCSFSCSFLQNLYKTSAAKRTSSKVSQSSIIRMIAISSSVNLRFRKLPILKYRFARSARLKSSTFPSDKEKKSSSFSSRYPLKNVLASPAYLIFIIFSMRASSTTFTNWGGIATFSNQFSSGVKSAWPTSWPTSKS